MSKFMILASIELNGKKLGYRCFTDKLNTDMNNIESKLAKTKVKISVYKALYGDMDKLFRIPDMVMYSDLSAFRDAIEC